MYITINIGDDIGDDGLKEFNNNMKYITNLSSLKFGCIIFNFSFKK